MWIWFAIPLGVGLFAAFISIVMHGTTEGIYIGIVEKDAAMGTGRASLHVRAYVDETLAHELRVPSRLIGRMFIREANTSVPLRFVRVPPFASAASEPEKRVESPVLPVIFRFDPAPGLAVHAGQLVDVYIGER